MNPQEQFWRGTFGDDYTTRNRVAWEARRPFWRKMLEVTNAGNALELGCNAGWNLMALRAENDLLGLVGVDVNEAAIAEARAAKLLTMRMPAEDAGNAWQSNFDLVFTAGVLIHVAPDRVRDVMISAYNASRRYVLAVEYSADAEEAVEYRGHGDRLWRRPFGRMYEALGMTLVESGQAEGFDRCTYWLMKK